MRSEGKKRKHCEGWGSVLIGEGGGEGEGEGEGEGGMEQGGKKKEKRVSNRHKMYNVYLKYDHINIKEIEKENTYKNKRGRERGEKRKEKKKGGKKRLGKNQRLP